MNRILLTILTAILLSLNIFAQKEKTPTLDGYNGTWILDEKRSFDEPEIRDGFEDFTLIISQNETEIKISKSYSFKGKSADYTITLFPDKRGEKSIYTVINAQTVPHSDPFYWLEDVKMESKTYSKNGKIIRTGNYRLDNDPHPFVIKETYSLSKDGKDLTIVTEKTLVATANNFDSFNPNPLNIPTIQNRTAVFHKKTE